MVYILAANVSFKYDSGARSHIIYIGTTGKGGRRPEYNKRKGSFANTDDIELFSEKALKKLILEFADA